MKNISKIILSTMLVATMSSCHIYNKYELPKDNAIIGEYQKSLEAPVDSAMLGNLAWNEVFTDTILQRYINQALEVNKDYKNAKLNIDIAHAQLKGAKLSYLPSLTFTPNGGAASYAGSPMSLTYSLPLAASWEIDVFGKLLNNKRKAQADLEQTEAYTQAVRSQIIGAVANTYYALVMLNQQLEITKNTASLWEEQVESMVLMKEAGRVNEAAVVQSRANYYYVLSTIPDIENTIHQTNNTLSLLLNTHCQKWDVAQTTEFKTPELLNDGIPVGYLSARPDVKAAEKSFASAFYATNIARTNFYPSLVISAQGGFTNLLGSVITNPGEWFVQLAGSLTAPIFSRGKNIATLEAAKAQQKQALNNFEYTVLNASAEVSNALVEISNNDAKRQMLILQVGQLEKSVEYTQELLYLGQATYLEVLSAQQSLLSAQLSSLDCWHAKVSAMINLYQALGGGR
ncbi:MAG: TolC family protein [Muribaculaceae bacterium]|nr:TolC family protein [Muribaculaceae bacterium]